MYYSREYAFTDSRQIPSFKGSVEIGTLKVQRLDENTKNAFKDRGKQFVALTGGHQHREYEGFMIPHTDQDPSSRPSFPGFPDSDLRLFSRSSKENEPQLVHFQVSHLQKILKLCELWKAVLLIDEAEAYLENRVYGNTMRNAVVTVLLRLLEYHEEVIFLTTNYIKRIDVAFKSRISVAIKYPTLDITSREKIWTRFLETAGVDILENELLFPRAGESKFTKLQLNKLAVQELNGR